MYRQRLSSAEVEAILPASRAGSGAPTGRRTRGIHQDRDRAQAGDVVREPRGAGDRRSGDVCQRGRGDRGLRDHRDGAHRATRARRRPSPRTSSRSAPQSPWTTSAPDLAAFATSSTAGRRAEDRPRVRRRLRRGRQPSRHHGHREPRAGDGEDDGRRGRRDRVGARGGPRTRRRQQLPPPAKSKTPTPTLPRGAAPKAMLARAEAMAARAEQATRRAAEARHRAEIAIERVEQDRDE